MTRIRRTFTRADKERALEQYHKAKHGEKAAVLEKYKLGRSLIYTWERELAQPAPAPAPAQPAVSNIAIVVYRDPHQEDIVERFTTDAEACDRAAELTMSGMGGVEVFELVRYEVVVRGQRQ